MKAYIGTTNGRHFNLTYEAGNEYKISECELKIHETGFLFFEKITDIDPYYNLRDSETKVFELEILGEVIYDEFHYECFTDHMRVIREIPRSEWSKCSKGEIKFDKKGNIIYIKFRNGLWEKRRFDKNDNEIYFESSWGYWRKTKYDKNNNKIYKEKSNGDWERFKFDKNNNQIYYENSNGEIVKNEISQSKGKLK
jgi:hypothetical protein